MTYKGMLHERVILGPLIFVVFSMLQALLTVEFFEFFCTAWWIYTIATARPLTDIAFRT